VGSRVYEATSIEITWRIPKGDPESDPPRWQIEKPPPDQPRLGSDRALIVYSFEQSAPLEPFSIVVDGLPRIDYVPVKRAMYGAQGG
jgi:hypothetical protein